MPNAERAERARRALALSSAHLFAHLAKRLPVPSVLADTLAGRARPTLALRRREAAPE